MGVSRNGARTFLEVMKKACQLSHLPGFRSGMNNILGADAGSAFFAVWEPLCAFVDILISTDDWYNKKDNTVPNEVGGEDTAIS